MDVAITKGIKISIETFYQPQYSKPVQEQYIFAYRVTIENTSMEVVQLERRHWRITDATGDVREVEGEGVIGQQPILKPGETHQYVSWCHLPTPIGTMEGAFMMRGFRSHTLFSVCIPRFQMAAEPVLN